MNCSCYGSRRCLAVYHNLAADMDVTASSQL